MVSVSDVQDGEPVNTNEKKSHRVLFKDGALFFYRTMQSKKEQDGGEYWCVAKNHVGKAVSRHASLQIAGKRRHRHHNLLTHTCECFGTMFDTLLLSLQFCATIFAWSRKTRAWPKAKRRCSSVGRPKAYQSRPLSG